MTEEEFLNEIFKHVVLLESKPIEYRIYYNKDTGSIICYSQEDLAGDYILVTEQEYMNFNTEIFIVEDGKLVRKDIYIQNKLQVQKEEFKNSIRTFASIKNDKQFAVDSEYTNPTDIWNLNE
jgi:hypothetical protein